MKRDDDAKKSDQADEDGAPEGMQVGVVLLVVMGGLVVMLIALQMC